MPGGQGRPTDAVAQMRGRRGDASDRTRRGFQSHLPKHTDREDSSAMMRVGLGGGSQSFTTNSLISLGLLHFILSLVTELRDEWFHVSVHSLVDSDQGSKP